MIASVTLRGEACVTPSTGHDVDIPLVIDSNDNTSCTSNSNSETDSSANNDNRTNINRKITKKKKKRLPSWAFKMLNLAKDITIMVLVAVTYAALSNDPSETIQKPADNIPKSRPHSVHPSPSTCHKDVLKSLKQVIASYTTSKMSFLKHAISLVTFLLNLYNFCSPPKVTKGPSAYPFFPKDSVVTDWYRGQVSRAIEQARTSDISFIMFYAPWDAESQNARKQFELAARYMKRQVTFAAVNCWQPGTECRLQYSKVFNWPVLIAYPSHGRGIQYNGPILATHIIKFLQNICKPFVRVERQAYYGDAYIHAEVDASPSSYEFAVTYSTALRLLEKDPLRDIPFQVSTRSKIYPMLSIVMWNETLIYNNENGWRTDLLLTWIVRNLQQISPWVSPSGMKSLSLSNYIKPGPALILFTPRNPLLDYVDHKLMLQSIGHDYYLCENSADYNFRRNMTFFQSHSARLENFIRYNELKLKCSKTAKKKAMKLMSKPLPNVWTNNSCCSVSKQVNHCEKCDNGNYLLKDCKLSAENSCSYNSVINDFMEKNCQDETSVKIHYKTSMVTGEDDPLSPKNLIRQTAQEECVKFLTAERYESALFTNSLFQLMDVHNKYRISGLSCKSNSSLYLVAMDSLLYYHFAEKLGINVLSRRDKSAAVVINEQMETHYIMDAEVNDFTLRQFMQNFSRGSLERALDSNTQIKQKNTHAYAKFNNCTRESFCIHELHTNNFLPTIHQPNKAVIVMYYSKQCSFCNGISYAFLVAAKKFSFVDNIVFARIDGDLNLLPWEYTMYSYPTILFFPALRKSESRAFPRNIPVSVENIIGFVLTNLEPSLKIQAMWFICNQTKFSEERSVCLSSTRLEILSLIESTLRNWRKAPVRQKPEIFRKLQTLKHLHLLLAHSSQKLATIERSLNKLQSIPDHCRDYNQDLTVNNKKTRHKDEL